MNNSFQIIILAAGKSSRFRWHESKLLFPLCGMPLIAYTVRLSKKIGLPATIIIGPDGERLFAKAKTYDNDLQAIIQEQALGTGHALSISQKNWQAKNLIVLNADVPAIPQSAIESLMQRHIAESATVSFMTATYPDLRTHGYGRVIEKDGNIRIIEARDYEGSPEEGRRFNAGVYIINAAFAQKNLPLLNTNNTQKEFYITDLVSLASAQGLRIVTQDMDSALVEGINTLEQAAIVQEILYKQKKSACLDQGVIMHHPDLIYIDETVIIEKGATIYGPCSIQAMSTIAAHAVIQQGCIINNSHIGNYVQLYPYSIIHNSSIGAYAQIGPFAHIKNESSLHDRVQIGNFVEVNRSIINTESKAKHLSYIGDARIGKQVNIGAGTITCNYDGTQKHITTIKDNVFIGSNSALIAPITLETACIVAAGSTLTHDVPENALAIARERQVIKEQYRNHLPKKIRFNAQNTPESSL